jgi:integrase
MKRLRQQNHFYKSPRSSEKIHGSLRHSFIFRLANSEIPAGVREEIAGHSSEDIHGRYVYLEPAIQIKGIVNLHSLF